MGWWLSLGTSESQNAGSNQSTVSATLYLNWDGGSAYANYTQEWYINIGGNQTGGSAPSSANWNGSSWVSLTGSVAIGSHSVTFTHDANGYRGAVGTSASFDGDGGYAPGDISTTGTTYGAVDYDRKPSAPTSVTSTLNSDKSITVTSNSVSSPAGTATYYVSYSSDGGSTWSSYTTIPSNARTYTYALGSLTLGLNYRFRMYASNSDGSSAAFTQTSDVFLPAGGKIYDGSSWGPTLTAKRYTGSAWQTLTTAKRYDGSSWINLS